MNLTKIAETGSTITLGWTPPANVGGYVLYANGQVASVATANLKNGNPRNRAEFSKTNPGPPFQVAAVCRANNGTITVDVGQYPGTPVPEPEPEPTTWGSRSYLRWRAAGMPPSHVGDYDLVMMDAAWANPTGAKKVLRYSNAFALADSDADGRFAVTKAQARASGWVLKDSANNELVMTYYPQYLAADVGVRAYQDAWADIWIPKLRAQQVDGVFIDDGGRNFPPTSPGSTAKYLSPDARETAMISFHRRIAERLQAEGFYVCSSAGGYTSGDPRSDTGEIDALYWEKLCATKPYPDAIFLEYWQCHSNIPGYIRKQGTTSWVLHWDGWQDALRRGLALDVDWLGMCDSEDLGHGVYCYASMLLEWKGRGSYVWAPYGSDPWLEPPGAPLGAKRKNGNRWERDFTRGLVWVDPVAGTASIP